MVKDSKISALLGTCDVRYLYFYRAYLLIYEVNIYLTYLSLPKDVGGGCMFSCFKLS